MLFPAPLGGGQMLEGCAKGDQSVCIQNALTTLIINRIGGMYKSMHKAFKNRHLHFYATATSNKTVAPYVYNETLGSPDPFDQCYQFFFYYQYLTYAVSRSFQNLYDNVGNQTSMFIDYWVTVVTSLKEHPNILGYEIINEPWVGFYPDILVSVTPEDLAKDKEQAVVKALSVYAGRNLARLYEKVFAAIRPLDPERLMFFESITFDNEHPIPFDTLPGTVPEKTILSYHYYDQGKSGTY
jgi:hypothetical protein